MHVLAAVSKHRTLQPFEGARPQLGRDNFVAPNASLIGNVKLGDQSSVFYGAVVRGEDHVTAAVASRPPWPPAVSRPFMQRRAVVFAA